MITKTDGYKGSGSERPSVGYSVTLLSSLRCLGVPRGGPLHNTIFSALESPLTLSVPGRTTYGFSEPRSVCTLYTQNRRPWKVCGSYQKGYTHFGIPDSRG